MPDEERPAPLALLRGENELCEAEAHEGCAAFGSRRTVVSLPGNLGELPRGQNSSFSGMAFGCFKIQVPGFRSERLVTMAYRNAEVCAINCNQVFLLDLKCQ